jgi:hypothetical protein
MAVGPAALDVAGEQMIGHRRERAGRNLCPGAVVEKDEAAGALERRELTAHLVDREEVGGTGGRGFIFEHGRWRGSARRQWT